MPEEGGVVIGTVRKYGAQKVIVFRKFPPELSGTYEVKLDPERGEALLIPSKPVTLKLSRVTYIPRELWDFFEDEREVELEALPGGALLLRIKRKT